MISENLGVPSGQLPQRRGKQIDRLHLAPEDCLHFDIRRDDQVRASSTLFCGGMWRWRLSSRDGTVLATSAEYPDEEACNAALSVIRQHAGTASFHGSKGEFDGQGTAQD